MEGDTTQRFSRAEFLIVESKTPAEITFTNTKHSDAAATVIVFVLFFIIIFPPTAAMLHNCKGEERGSRVDRPSYRERGSVYVTDFFSSPRNQFDSCFAQWAKQMSSSPLPIPLLLSIRPSQSGRGTGCGPQKGRTEIDGSITVPFDRKASSMQARIL